MGHMAYVISVENHELSYGDWLTMVFEVFNVPLIDKQVQEPKRYDFFKETFLTMCQLKRENGVWWLGTTVTDEVEIEKEEVCEEAEVQGKSGSGEKFYDAEDEVQGSADVIEEASAMPAPDSIQQKETEASRVDPSAPTGSIPDSVFVSLQAELERPRAYRIQYELDGAQAENARLLALLQQAQSQHKP
ncbi:hypothetical protein Dimus_024478 [Dionaea muscipula]